MQIRTPTRTTTRKANIRARVKVNRRARVKRQMAARGLALASALARGDKVAVEEILQAAARAVTRLVAQEVLSEMFRRPHAGGVVGPTRLAARPLLPAGYLLPEWATHLRPHSPAGTVSRTVVIPLPQPTGLSVSTLQTAVSRTLIRELISLRQVISPPTR